MPMEASSPVARSQQFLVAAEKCAASALAFSSTAGKQHHNTGVEMTIGVPLNWRVGELKAGYCFGAG